MYDYPLLRRAATGGAGGHVGGLEREMRNSMKGYWLFDRNSNTINLGEAIMSRKTGRLMTLNFRDSLTIYSVRGPFAVYKWVEQ